MGTIVRPDMLKNALGAKLAAAAAQLLELREAEQPRLTPHLSPPEIIGAFLVHVRGIHPIVDVFGRAQAGELVFKAWHETWRAALSKADLALWDRLRDDHQGHEHGAELIEDEISVSADASATGHESRGPRADVRKRRFRFAADPKRPASDVCADYLRLARRFVEDFVRAHEQFLK
jgi:hypothetical protein